MRTIKPITPNEAANKQDIPDFVLDAFNQLISKNYRIDRAIVVQKHIIELIKKKSPNQEFETNWLNIEPIYENAGWKVIYDKPAYCENYDAFFMFIKS